MFLTHGRGGQRFNSVKNSVRKTEKYCAAKEDKRMFRELYLIYEIFYECYLTADKFVCGFLFFKPILSHMYICSFRHYIIFDLFRQY